ncbi:MAG TPA: alpha/beta hydrolase [Jiangellales bacterium]|nr:alpha/beta hydrolase [Jiangellales bacterium]
MAEVDDDVDLPAVAIVAGTAIRGLAATLMMQGVMRRHPNAFLVTLERWGVTIPLHESQSYVRQAISDGLERMDRDLDEPVVVVGHSQGGLAALRYGVDHPGQARRIVTVGAPWNGARLAGTVNGLARRLIRRDVPALADMTPDSPFLQALHADVPAIAERVTNIYSTHDGLIEPYVSAHIPVDGVTNVLVATWDEYERHVRRFGLSHPIDELIEGRVNHLAEMSDPQIRSVIWRVVDELDRSL